jgi:hypothetical protein
MATPSIDGGAAVTVPTLIGTDVGGGGGGGDGDGGGDDDDYAAFAARAVHFAEHETATEETFTEADPVCQLVLTSPPLPPTCRCQGCQDSSRGGGGDGGVCDGGEVRETGEGEGVAAVAASREPEAQYRGPRGASAEPEHHPYRRSSHSYLSSSGSGFQQAKQQAQARIDEVGGCTS